MKAKKPKVHRLRRNKAGRAVGILRKAFAEATRNDCLWHFWGLVGGLRGPDAENISARIVAKQAGTQALRCACFPTVAQAPAFYKSFAAPGQAIGWQPHKVNRQAWAAGDHWYDHIRDAIGVCHEAFATTRSDEGGQESGEDKSK